MSEMVLLVMLALNGGQGDLLSMVPTDSYWHEQKIAVAADQMIPLITTKGAPDISDLAKKLGSDKQQEREDAQKQIVAMGPAVLPQVQALLKSSDAEVVTRAQAIIKELSASPAGLQRLMAIRTLG